MATIKKSAVKVPKATASPKAAPQKAAAKGNSRKVKPITGKSGDELIAANIAALSKVVESLSTTLAMLVQKAESMAHHVIATEEILAELVASNGLNLARVNARIRAKIAAGTDNNGDANLAIDIAAAIASPLPRR